MLIALAIALVVGQGIQALPILVIEGTPSTCFDLRQCRTLWNIIWSCIFTIFSCTWVAVHSNIPGPDETRFAITLRRLGVMAVALTAPELIIWWAIRQWIAARKLGKRYKKYNWTQTHGFFAVMGGFMLFDGDKALRTLRPDEIEPHLINGDINITKKEIQDKSRGDVLSKGLVVVQTTWFVLQCTARGVEHIPITELELVTVAFSTLNLVTYALWWNKPLSVWTPHPVRRISIAVKESEKEEGSPARWVWAIKDAIIAIPKVPSIIVHAVWKALTSITHAADNVLREQMFGQLIYLLTSEFRDGAKRVPTFYAGELTNIEAKWAAIATGVIAMVFGGIHCMAWSFRFPSHTEQLLWRIFSLVIICEPVLTPLPVITVIGSVTSAIISAITGSAPVYDRSWMPHWMGRLFVVITLFLAPAAYVVARIALMVLAFMSLRSLSPEAYHTVHWTTLIPHI